jgi:hypothetical protein
VQYRAVPNIERERLLILTKTYPSPSGQYRETTCVAAVNEKGEMRRIFPVPFRLLEGGSRFHKWEWIEADVQTTSKDQRPESRRIDVDSIARSGTVIPTDDHWSQRRRWIDAQIVPSYAALEQRRQTTGETLGILRPTKLVSLDITPVAETEWTPDDTQKRTRDGLFDTPEVRGRAPLRKLPLDLHYRYEIETAEGVETLRHKITDWETGALYWHCHGKPNCHALLRQRLESEFSQKDLLLLMGTIHRFPDQWLIVGLIYPPKPPAPPNERQLDLGLGL